MGPRSQDEWQSAAEHSLGHAAKPLVTAYTISLADPETMAAKTAENAGRPLLKIKTGTADDEARLRAVRTAAPDARIIIDANEGWNDDNIEYYLKLAAELNIALIEQPLPAGKDAIWPASTTRSPSAPMKACIPPRTSQTCATVTMRSTSSWTRPAVSRKHLS